MKRVLLAAGALFLFFSLSLPGGLWWLIASEAGNGVLLDKLAPLIGAKISIGERRGDISGALEWRDISYEDRYVLVTAKSLKLNWKPLRLYERLVSVQDLSASGLEVHLKPSDSPSPPSDAPPLSRLPVNIGLEYLRVDDLKLWLAGAEQPIVLPHAEISGRWIGSRLTIKKLEADYPQAGHISLQGDVDLSGKGVTVRKLSVLSPVLATAKGFVGYKSASDLQIAWRDLVWPLPGVAGAAADAPPMVSSQQGEATLKGPWSDIQFSLAAALGDHGQLKADGRWNGQLDARAQWTQLSWPMIAPPPSAANAKTPPPYQSARGALSFKGLPEQYAFDLDADLVAQQQAGHVTTRGSGTLQSVDLQALKLQVGTGLLEAAGQLAWAPQPGGALKGKVEKFDPGLLLPGWPGDINGEFSVEGELAQKSNAAEPALRFTIALHDSRLRNYPLKLDAEGRYADQVLDIASLELRSGASVLTASGRASEPYDVQARLVSPHMNELAPGLGGSINASAHLRGTLKAPSLSAEAELARASWQDYSLASLKLKTEFDWNGALMLDAQAKDLMVGTHLDSVELHGEGTRGDHRLKLALASHDIKADVSLAGGWDDKAQLWQGQIGEGHVTPAKLPAWSLEQAAPLLLSAQRNDLGPACWSANPGKVCVEAHQAPDQVQARLQIEQLAFASFKALMPDDMKIEGELNGTAAVEISGGVLRQANAELTTTAGSMQLGERKFKFLPAHLTVSDAPEQGRAELRLPLEVGGIEGDATLAPGEVLGDRPLSGDIRIDFPDLAFLAVLSNEISSATGKLAGAYRIGGKLSAPEFQGEARLTGGTMKLTRPGIELADLNATVTGQPDGSVHLVADATSGGGKLHVDGQVLSGPLAVEPVSGSPAPNTRRKSNDARTDEVTAATVAAAAAPPTETANANAQAGQAATPTAVGPEPSLSTQPPPPASLPTENSEGLKLVVQVDGDNFQVANLAQAQVWASPNLRFTLSGKEASLKGRLTIPRADVRLQQGEDTGVGPSSDQVIVDASGKAPEPAESFSLATEVKLVLGDKVKLEGYGLKTRLEGAVTAVDQPGRETLGYGEFHLEDGEYKAYGQDLRIETGKLLFNGGPIAKPGLEIKAEKKETDEVTVGIYVRGSLEKPVLSLYSSPSMTQQQQLSWLLYGQPLEQSSTSSQDRSALTGAAMALGLGGGSLLASGLQKGLGLDSISLGADPGETQEQARLTVGKYLTPKIFVSYGVGLFQPGQVFKLLYDLGRGFKLSTESGSGDQSNFAGGDLLYQVETR
ncbi:translocation/assembly module TamB domain-containing protein [Hydrocarboniphaga sp.]|uniref:translocation/assembly module TamB domain-containing protein n=1 Tax=Hydrocarboniphaga sp. TaxID=2033016 RepID=UPI003D0FCCE7